MKPNVYILDDYQKIALSLAPWTDLDANVQSVTKHFESTSELVSRIQDAAILVVMRERTRISRELIAQLPNLKLIVTSGMRNSAIDLVAANERGVKVCGTKSFSEPPMELTWALILGLARNVLPEANAFRTGGAWQSTIGMDLRGSQLGLVGLGKIGSQIAKIAQAFGMNVVAWSPNLTPERAAAEGVSCVTKEELFASSDFVSLHLVLSDRTRGVIGKADLKRMKPTAYFINTSRSGLVDREALLSVLVEKRIAGAGLDVFDQEPVAENDPLRKLSNVLATPHLGYVSKRNYQTYFKEAVEDIASFLSGTAIRELR